MELRHVRYFVMAAEEKNISRASARLNISQPAVSRQIRDLEEELGVALFKRERNGLRLTDAGESALVHARELLRGAIRMAEAMKAFTEHSKKNLRLGFIPTALPGFLADGLREFNKQQKHVCVQIREMTQQQQEKALRDGQLDLALLGHPCPKLRKEFRIEPIHKTPLAAVLPDHHVLALRKSIDLAELDGESFVSLHEKNFPGRPELMTDLGERAGFTLNVRFRAEGFPELLGLVASGAGVAILPADVDQLPHPRVVFVKLKRPKVYLVSSAAWRQDRETRDLLDLVAFLKKASSLS